MSKSCTATLSHYNKIMIKMFFDKIVRFSITPMAVFLLFFQGILAQQVRNEIDTTSVKIGERVNYKIVVSSDSLPQVQFPKNKSFGNWTVVDSLDMDTLKLPVYQITKNYELIGFNENLKSIPQQKVSVNGKLYDLDSILVEVRGVEVDTISKEFYANKALTQEERQVDFFWILKILFVVVAVVLSIYFGYKKIGKRIKISRKAKLKPDEKALQSIEKLLSSDLIIKRAYKTYYSELTTTLKHYLEEQIDLSIKESTSVQLLKKLKLYINQYDIKFEAEILKKLETTLSNSDLAKFAKMIPDSEVVSEDVLIIKNFISDIERTIPKEIIEERIRQEQILENERVKKKLHRKRLAILGAVGMLIIVLGMAVSKYGFVGVFDKITGYSTRRLLDMDWVTADYGFPPLVVSTPEVLKRIKMVIPESERSMFKDVEAFSMGSVESGIYMDINQIHLNKPLDSTQVGMVLESHIFKKIESFGGENIISKQDDFVTPSGVEGGKYYGSFTTKQFGEALLENYIILIFMSKENILFVHLLHSEDDRYAFQIVEKVISSVDFKIVK